MGKADTVTKAFMRKNEIFADAFNFLIYDGASVVSPQNLKELDTTELALPYGDNQNDHSEGESIQKYRDILKSLSIKQDEDVSYILLGIENQTDIHYAMPVRNMLYDALQYEKQVSNAAAKHRKKGDKAPSRGEYLSGYWKADKIRPVITLVIHFGAKKWDGPLSLHEMMDFKDERLSKYIQDYKIFLIDPATLSDKDLRKFSTDLGDVLGYIKYSSDMNQLNNFVTQNLNRCISADAARVMRDITNTPINIEHGMEAINMCKAIQDMIAEGIAEGKAKGIAEGKAEGIAEGKAEGIKKFSKLINILSKEKRYDDIEKVTEDAAYRDLLMKEYKLL